MDHDLSNADKGNYKSVDDHQGGSPSESSKGHSSMRVRCMYGIFLFLGFAFALISRNDVVQFITKWMIEHDSACTTTHCVGNQGAYRISFGLFIFFLVHMILSSRCNLCMTSAQKIGFNRASFCWKLLAIVPLMVIAFIIPNPFFVVYAWFCVFASIFFLLAQLIILLDFSYNWSEKWGQEEESRYMIGLMVSAVVLYVVGLTVVGLLYHWFGSSTECQIGQGMISVTLIAAVFYTFASIVASHGSIIPAGTVFVYTVWTCYSALSSGIPAGICNKLAPTSTSQIIVSVIFCGVAMVYTCISAGASRKSFQLGSDDDDEEVPTEDDEEASNYTFFHIIMMLGSCYLAMLVTNWEISGTSGTGMAGVDSGVTPMWVKFGTELMCMILFLWTLIAPKCCADREYGAV